MELFPEDFFGAALLTFLEFASIFDFGAGLEVYWGLLDGLVNSELAGGVGLGGVEVGFDTVVSGALVVVPEEGTKAELIPLLLSAFETAMEFGVAITISELTLLDESSGFASAFACARMTENRPTQTAASPVKMITFFDLLFIRHPPSLRG